MIDDPIDHLDIASDMIRQLLLSYMQGLKKLLIKNLTWGR
jgi:hypothetical protein